MGSRELGKNQPDAAVVGSEFIAERLEVLRFVPVQLVQVEEQAAPAARQGILNALAQLFGVGLGEDALETHPDLLFRVLQIDVNGQVGNSELLRDILPEMKRTPLFV